MHRIDTPDATRDGRFTEGDPSVPVPATTVSADWLNAVQEEVIAVMTEAGLAPAKNDNAQLLAALKKVVGTVNALTATRLETARHIDGVSFNGTADIHHYATCATASGTAAKTAALAGFRLQAGAALRVKFANANTAANATLNVGGTGAKPLHYHGKAVPAGLLAAGHTYAVVYNGTQYEIIGDILVLAGGGGLAFDVKGHLYVDTSAFSEEMLRAFLRGIIADGGGLGFDQSGKLYVDAEAFSDDLFAKFVSGIRVPIWLSRSMTIYVATTGSDTLDEGRGFTPEKPFATLQAALNHVSTTYNLYLYTITVYVAAGDYGRKTISLPAYQTTSGYIRIIGEERDSTRVGRISNASGSYYYIISLTADPIDAIGTQVAYYSSNGTLSLLDVGADLIDTQHGSDTNLIPVCVEGSGDIRIPSSDTYKTGLFVRVAADNSPTYILYASQGSVIVNADITVEGVSTVIAFSYATRGGSVAAFKSSYANPGRFPIFTGVDISGKRYLAIMNGTISVNKAGPDVFPGTIAGTTATGGQYA